jgi:hypothetical protein
MWVVFIWLRVSSGTNSVFALKNLPSPPPPPWLGSPWKYLGRLTHWRFLNLI